MITSPRRRRAIIAAAALAAAGVLLSACSAGGTGAAPTGSAFTLGIVTYDTTAVAAKVETDAASEYAKKEGWTVLSQDPKGDAAQANSICQQYVTRQVNAIVVSVYSSDQMAQCLSSSSSANIPVFFMASKLNPGMAGAISTTGAAPINDLFIQQVKSLPNLHILAMTLQPGAPCREREADLMPKAQAAGIAGAIEKHEVKVPGQVTDAQAATQAWLSAHPASQNESLVVWACFADPAVGAYSAIQQAGRTNIPIYTWDLTKPSVDPLRSGAIAATLSLVSGGDTGEGAQIVKMIKTYLTDKQAKAEEAKFVVLTKDNIDQYLKDNPSAAN